MVGDYEARGPGDNQVKLFSEIWLSAFQLGPVAPPFSNTEEQAGKSVPKKPGIIKETSDLNDNT